MHRARESAEPQPAPAERVRPLPGTVPPVIVSAEEPTPEECRAGAAYVKNIYHAIAGVLGDEWELPDSLLPLIGRDAALSIRKRIAMAKEPEGRLALALGPHTLGAATTTFVRVRRERAAGAGGGARPPGRAAPPSGDGRAERSAQSSDLRTEGLRQDDLSLAVIGTPVTGVDS